MRLLTSIVQDTRYALRTLRNSPGLSAVAILSLALAIGSTTAIFAVMYALIFRPLPVFQPDRLAEVARSDGADLHPYAVWKQLQDKQGAFSGLFAYYAWGERFNLTDERSNQDVAGMFVSGGFFQTLGVPAILGRTFTPADDRTGAVPVCVIGYGLWRRQYGQSPSVLGRTIVLNQHAFQIVGVAPRSFFGVEVGAKPELFLPLEMQRLFRNPRWPNGVPKPTLEWGNALSIIGRLRPGISASQADAWLRVVGTEIYRSLPAVKDARRTLIARALPTGMSRSYFSDTALLLMIMAGVGLIIACANLGNLLLARATKRQGEIATRLALGATRGRLVRQLMTESIVLSLAGAALGLALKNWGSQALLWVISFSGESTIPDLSWDAKLLVFAVALPLLAALLFGLAPALRATGLPLYSAMQTGSPTRYGGNRFGNAVLIVVQVVLSIALFHSAGLLVRTLHALVAKDPGYEAKGVLVAQVSLEAANADPQREAAEGDELLRAFRSVPGVMSASWTANFSKNTLPELSVPQPSGPERRAFGYRFFVSPDYLKTRRTPMQAGRDFNASDNAESPPVAILSDQAARRFFPGLNPIGLSFHENDDRSSGHEYSVRVVGVARDIDFQTPQYGPLPILYRPVAQCSACLPMGRYEVRFAGPLRDLTKCLKMSAAKVDPNLALEMHTLTDEFDAGVKQNRAVAWTATLFGLFAGLLAMIGVYGVTSYAAAQRTREIGLRLALGAQPASVFRMILGETATVVVIGVALGVPVGYAAAQALRGMLWGVTAADPLTLAGASATMLAVASLAAFFPARRAMRVDPMTCLRYE
jgi:predicted permease